MKLKTKSTLVHFCAGRRDWGDEGGTVQPPPPLVWGAVFLKRRTGRGPGPRPLNNNAALARYALDTTPAEVHETSVEVESIYAKFKILLTVLIPLYQMAVTAL